MSKRDVYVFDLDGTLFDNSARTHLVPQDGDNWTEWGQACHLDTVIAPVAALLRDLNDDAAICYATARSVRDRDATVAKLKTSGLPHDVMMIMRPDGDDRCAAELKVDQYKAISDFYNIILGIDDNQDVVDLLQSAGYCMLKVGYNNDK